MNFTKTVLHNKCFSWEFSKILKPTILENTCEQPLVHWFSGTGRFLTSREWIINEFLFDSFIDFFERKSTKVHRSTVVETESFR